MYLIISFGVVVARTLLEDKFGDIFFPHFHSDSEVKKNEIPQYTLTEIVLSNDNCFSLTPAD